MPASPDLHRSLVELSRVDRDLHEVGRRSDALPARLARLAERRAAVCDATRRLEAAAQESARDRRRQEAELERVGEEIARFERQVGAVASNEEYQAMQQQLARARERRAELEEAVLGAMAAEENLAAECATEARGAAQALDDLEHDRQALAAEETTLGEREAALLDRRRRAIEALPADCARRYETLLPTKSPPVVPVQKSACGGCFTAVPAQRIQEVQLAEALVHCDGCGRLLVWDEDAAESAH